MHFDEQTKYNILDRNSSGIADTGTGASAGGWHTGTEVKCADKCSHGDSSVKAPTFYVSIEMLKVIRQMCKEFPKDEWQMLLKGREFQDGADGLRVEFDGYYIPKQEVSGASVKNIDDIGRKFIKDNNIVAGIHSHVNMHVFFSTTDDETCKSGIKHHIVVNNDMKFIGRSRFALPCGMEYFKDAVFEFEEDTVSAVKIEGLDKISRTTYAQESWCVEPQEYIEYNHKSKSLQKFQQGGFTADEIAHLSGFKDEKQLSLFKDYGMGEELNKDTPTEGTYWYDDVNDTYYLDDDTVIVASGVPRDPITQERYLYGVPHNPDKI